MSRLIDTITAVGIAVQTGDPIHVQGLPGVGKTASMHAMTRTLDAMYKERAARNPDAKVHGCRLQVLIAAIREPSDFSGLPLPYSEGGRRRVYLAAPGWADEIVEWAEKKIRTLIFYDEITQAPPLVQGALLRPVQEYVVGDTALPLDYVSNVLASNPPDIAAGGWELSFPLANRMIHLVWDTDRQFFVNGMVAGFPDPEVPLVPESWMEHFPAMRRLVASFLHGKIMNVHMLPTGEHISMAWPSPRTWDMAARQMAACESVYGSSLGVGDKAKDPGYDIKSTLIAGCVGEGAGLEFLGYLREMDLPRPEDVLKDPDHFMVPKRGDHAFAVLCNTAAYVVDHLADPKVKKAVKEALWVGGWTVLGRASDQKASDTAAAAAQMLAKARNNDLPIKPIVKHLQPFIPLLEAAGLKPKSMLNGAA